MGADTQTLTEISFLLLPGLGPKPAGEVRKPTGLPGWVCWAPTQRSDCGGLVSLSFGGGKVGETDDDVRESVET